MMFGYGGHGDFWQVALMGIGMVVFVGLLVWALFAFFRNGDPQSRTHHADDARTILDRRLAKGEIDADEYRRLVGLVAHGTAIPTDT
jgi:putative membrane protein